MESVKNLSLQSRVYIELNDGECYTGILKAYNQKFKFIELTELTDTVSGQKLDGVQTLYESEIEKIRALDATPSDSVKSTESSNEDEQKKCKCNGIKSLHSKRKISSSLDVKSIDSEFKSAKEGSSFDEPLESISTTIDEDEMQKIDARIRSTVHIAYCDASYHAALDDLRRQEIVGMNIEGARLGRLRHGSLLSFSTNEKIYLFDLKLLGKIFPEMKRILEAEKPRKVVHNSCFIVDHLQHRYKCQLNGIQDTLITHFQIKKKKNVITIDDCLSEYFNFPVKAEKKIETDWNKRPLSDRRKFIAATNVAYLIKLFFHMSVDVLLRPLQRMTIEYAQTYSQNDDAVDVMDQITRRRNPGLAAIDTNANNLYAFTLLDLS